MQYELISYKKDIKEWKKIADEGTECRIFAPKSKTTKI